MTLTGMINSFPPALIFLAGAILVPFLNRRARALVFILISVASFVAVLNLEIDTITKLSFLNFEIVPLRVDKLSLAFGYVFSIIAFLGGIYAFHVKSRLQHVAALVYAGGALGAVFAGDLFTLYVFWEVMLLGSACLIWSRKTKASGKAGMRYIIVHLTGGSFLLGGILWHFVKTGSLEFISLPVEISSLLILIGFAVNAAIPPLHAWLADAYPESTVTGTIFLSAFTTKVAVYTLIRGFESLEILVWAGAVMAVYGAVFAFMENDIRRILAYHIISQVGFMVAAVGIGTNLAINGAVAHAFAHILYKALLLMGTGAVLYATGKSKLTELGGLFKAMPVVFMLYMIGGVSISGFPLFSGFVSKGIVLYAAENSQYVMAFLLLSIASVGTFLHTGLKLPYYIWFGRKSNIQFEPLPRGMYIGMTLTALGCIVIGVKPSILYSILPYEVTYQPYTLAHLWETGSMLIFTGLVFWLMIDMTRPKPGVIIDFDWFYRRSGRYAYQIFVCLPAGIFGQVERVAGAVLKHVVNFGSNPMGAMIYWTRRTGSIFRKQACTVNEEPYEFDPHRYRTPLGFMVVMVMLAFVIIALASIIG